VDISSSKERHPDARNIPDTSNDVAEMEMREPMTSARAARMGGGVALATLALEGGMN
jgi:hypothetical protein